MVSCFVSPLRRRVSPPPLRIFLLWTLFLAVGCGGGVTAPTTPDGNPVEIMMLFDANIDTKASADVKADHERVARWMENDITTRFKAGGYTVTATDDVKKFVPGSGKFLLTIKIVEYVPASATSREEAGFGAGTTIIDTYSELFKDNHTIPRFRLKKGNVTARDWTVCAEEVTTNVTRDISAAIHELQ